MQINTFSHIFTHINYLCKASSVCIYRYTRVSSIYLDIFSISILYLDTFEVSMSRSADILMDGG